SSQRHTVSDCFKRAKILGAIKNETDEKQEQQKLPNAAIRKGCGLTIRAGVRRNHAHESDVLKSMRNRITKKSYVDVIRQPNGHKEKHESEEEHTLEQGSFCDIP